MMGGDVTVHSVPGEGSVFTIKLPAVVSEPPETAAGGRRRRRRRVRGCRGATAAARVGSCVLVIDDDPTQRDLMQRFLSKEGFRVRTASGGEEGLRLAASCGRRPSPST